MTSDKIIDNLLKVYAVGAMEDPADKDGGVGWRRKLIPELKARGIYTFDPTREEIDKVGMPTEELMNKLTGWQLSGNWELFVKYMRMVWRGTTKIKYNEDLNERQMYHILGDVGYVENSDFLVWHHKEGDKPGGTIAELVIAWYRGIPVYLVTDMPKSRFNKSLLYFILDSGHGQGRIFSNFNQLLEFIDDKYNLTRKDEHENTK